MANGGSPEPAPLAFDPDPGVPLRLLAACPAYRPSPLRAVRDQADHELLIKDESERLGLGSFKALGGVYAVARLVERRWSETGHGPLEPENFRSAEVKDLARAMTFVCASAGNHGLAVATGARLFGARARIHLSAGVSERFEQRLIAKDATVLRSGETYEDSVAEASRDAEATGAILLADGSWPGYFDPPSLVMEGYNVIAQELRTRFEERGDWPSHVFIQAGVGGLAASMAISIRERWARQPDIIVVEPDAAACLQASHEAGRPLRAEGPASTMGRLDCKEPSLIAFHALERAEVGYLAVTDDEAEAAADELADLGLPTTASGAAGLAGLRKGGSSRTGFGPRPLIIVTEGQF